MSYKLEIIKNPAAEEAGKYIKQAAENIYPPDKAAQRSFSLSALHKVPVFMVVRNAEGETVGTSALYHNTNLTFEGKPAIALGHFEALNHSVADLLLQKARQEAAHMGFHNIVGPMNGSTWEDYRLNADAGKLQIVPEPWYMPWYNDAFIQNGFEVAARYYSSADTLNDSEYAPFFTRVANRNADDLVIRYIDMNDIDNELHKVADVVLQSFQSNLFYTPISADVFVQKYKAAMSRLEPWQVLIAEHKGRPVGLLYGYTMPAEQKTLVMKTLARLPDEQFRELGKALVFKMMKDAQERNYTQLIRTVMKYNNGFWDANKFSLGHVQKDYNLYLAHLD
ncbi:MAG: GNAT family N-acetyltransferase [Bacteroidota bacterium]